MQFQKGQMYSQEIPTYIVGILHQHAFVPMKCYESSHGTRSGRLLGVLIRGFQMQYNYMCKAIYSTDFKFSVQVVAWLSLNFRLKVVKQFASSQSWLADTFTKIYTLQIE